MSTKFTYISEQIITNNTNDKEYFNPRKRDINTLIKQNENWKIFKAGSAVFFDNYDDYNPHDYDYLIMTKIDKLHNPIQMCYKYLVDIFEYFYLENWTKDDIIQDIINHSKDTLYLNKHLIVNLLNKDILTYFNISYSDFEKYIDSIKTIINEKNFSLRNAYYIKILNYYIINKSFNLTQEQLDDCYLTYKQYRKKQYK